MSVVPAHEVVAEAVTAHPVESRGAYLRELLTFAAAALVFTEGKRAATEAVYRIADALPGVDQ